MNVFLSLRSLARKHILAIACALFTGLFIVAPQLVFIANEGPHYKGLYMMMNTESEWYYLGRMQEVYDEGRIGNPYLYEHKFHGPIFISPGGETIAALPGKLLGISVPTLNLIEKFVFPAITYLLLYALLFRLTASIPLSIAGSFMFLLGVTWFYTINLSHLLHLDRSFFTEFVYNRPIHPQFDGMVTFLYFHLLLSAHRSRDIRWFVVLAVVFALSFYTYFYSFTFFFALNVVTVLLWLYFGKKQEAFRLGYVTVAGLLAGLPALRAIFGAMHHVDYPQITAYSTQYGHMPEISKNGLLVSFFFIAFLIREKAQMTAGVLRDHALYLAALLATTFVVVNQQVLTGIGLHSGHYHHNFNIPVFILVIVFLAGYVSRCIKERRAAFEWVTRVLPWVATAVFIGTGAIIQYYSYINDAPRASEDQRYMPALSWLRERTPKDSVVMTNEVLSELIPVYTRNNVMWSLGSTNYLMPPDRVRFTPERLLESQEFLKDIKKYRVDYILWDRKYDPKWDIDRFGLPVLFLGESLTIYELPR